MQQQASAKGDGSVRRKVPGNGESMLGFGISGAKKNGATDNNAGDKGTKIILIFLFIKKTNAPRRTARARSERLQAPTILERDESFQQGLENQRFFNACWILGEGTAATEQEANTCSRFFEATQDGATWVVAVGRCRE